MAEDMFRDEFDCLYADMDMSNNYDGVTALVDGT